MLKMTFVTKAAFTFIELIIVCLIMGILIGVAMPQIKNAWDNLALENFAKGLYTRCAWLQANAIAETRIYYLGIEKEGSEFIGYILDDNQYYKLSGRLGEALQLPFGARVLGPVSIAGIHFYPDGSSDPVNLTFESRRQNKVAFIVKGVSGEISVQ